MTKIYCAFSWGEKGSCPKSSYKVHICKLKVEISKETYARYAASGSLSKGIAIECGIHKCAACGINAKGW